MSAIAMERKSTVTDLKKSMKAIVHERYGRPNVLELREVELPVIEDNQVLVRVHASSVNPVEWYGVTGPYFARFGNGWRTPKDTTVGGDFAGRDRSGRQRCHGVSTG